MMEYAAQIVQDLKYGSRQQKFLAIQKAQSYVLNYSYFPEAVPLLLKLLGQEEYPQLAAQAAWALWKFKDERATPLLLQKALESKHTIVREKALRSLGLLEVKEALSLFRKIVSRRKEFTPKEQAAAIFALGFFKERQDLKSLKRQLRSAYPQVRQETILALLRFFRSDPKSLSFFVRRRIIKTASWRREPSEDVRLEALHALCFINPKKAKRLLIRAYLKNPSERVRQRSLFLLQLTGGIYERK